MTENSEQIRAYRENGFLLMPGVFSSDEIGLLKARLPNIFAEDSPRRILEKDGTTVRSVYGSHFTEPLFRRLTRDLRLLDFAEKIIDGDVYVHQVKINSKLGFTGDIWEWHQDYIFWLKEDGVLKSDLTTAAVFLDEVTEFNGPLLFVPGSHQERVIDVEADVTPLAGYRNGPEWLSNLTADLKYSIPRDAVMRLINERGIVAPKGPPGSVLFFHPNVVHASSSNVSPFDRVLALITYNSVNNIPTKLSAPRPYFLCGRDFMAVKSEPSFPDRESDRQERMDERTIKF